MARYVVGPVAEIPPGARKIVDANGRSIGVFNVHGTYYALRNTCPHQAAPLCLGQIKGTTLPSKPGEYRWAREGEILRCPWHGWEFDLTTGRSIFNPHQLRVKTYDVTIELGVEAPDVGALEPTPGCASALESDEDESVETFPVTVEDGWVILHT